MHGSHPKSCQAGAITLFIASMLLVAVTMLTFISAKTSLSELFLSANELRTRAALAAAEAGIHRARAWLVAPHSMVPGSSRGRDTAFIVGEARALVEPGRGPYVSSLYTVQAWHEGDNRLRLVSNGWSEDGSAERAVETAVRLTPLVSFFPPAPLIVRGAIRLAGQSTVTNETGNTTLWSGGPVELSGSTIVASGGSKWIASGGRSGLGPDVIHHDPSLANAAADTLFENFFAVPKASMKARADLRHLPSSVSESAGRLIWVEGDCELETDLGTSGEPVLLVVEGSLRTAGDVRIEGLVYVAGSWVGTGNLALNGAAVVEQEFVRTAGKLELKYEPHGIDQVEGPFRLAVPIPGTWRDWSPS